MTLRPGDKICIRVEPDVYRGTPRVKVRDGMRYGAVVTMHGDKVAIDIDGVVLRVPASDVVLIERAQPEEVKP